MKNELEILQAIRSVFIRIDHLGFGLALSRAAYVYSIVREKNNNKIIQTILKAFLFLVYTVLSIPVFLRLRVIVPSISLFITSRCTLRCKDCSNMIPYYESPYDANLDEMKRYILNFLEGVDVLYRATIIGGEPFLFNELGSLLEFLISQKKVRQIKVVTNGTLLPRKEWLNLLKNKKVRVVISNYGKYSFKLTECINILNENSVKTIIKQEDLRWISLGDVYYHGYTHNQLKNLYNHCPMRRCKLFIGGKLYVCGRSAASDDLGLIPSTNNNRTVESIDLTNSDPSRIRRDIRRIFNVKYLTSCNYCDGTMGVNKYVSPAIQYKGTRVPDIQKRKDLNLAE